MCNFVNIHTAIGTGKSDINSLINHDDDSAASESFLVQKTSVLNETHLIEVKPCEDSNSRRTSSSSDSSPEEYYVSQQLPSLSDDPDADEDTPPPGTRKCTECSCSDTPEWRKGPEGPHT